jgi:hypothetical protein
MSSPPARRGAGVNLRLEELEARDVPTAFASQAYVSTLFQGLLGRPADSPGLSYRTSLPNTGSPRTQAVTAPVFSALPAAASPAGATAADPATQTTPDQATNTGLVSAAIYLGTAATQTPAQTGQGPPSVAPGTPGPSGPGSATFGATGYGYPVNGVANGSGLGYGFPSYGAYNYSSLGPGFYWFPETF